MSPLEQFVGVLRSKGLASKTTAGIAAASINPKTLADQIIRAGAKARGEIVDLVEKPTGLAGQIIEAGRKRRGEV